MPIVTYSPWQDAANYGAGLGDTLGRILLQLPQQRAELAMQRQQFPLQQQLLQAQINEANIRPQLQQQGLALKSLQEQLAAQRAGVAEDYQRRRIQQIDEDEARKNNPPAKQPTPQQDYTQGRAAVTDFANNAAIKQGLNPKETPIGVSPELMKGALNAGGYGQAQDFLQKMGATLQAILSTNAVPQVTQHWGGWGTPTTNMVPEVKTNAYELRAPLSLPATTNSPTGTNAPLTATNPQTKQRIVSYDGGVSWQPIQ